MKIQIVVGLFLVLSACCSTALALNNGVARTPPMGWATWCTEDYCGLLDYCDENEVRSIADALVSTGMSKLGYNYILLDDCWSDFTRDEHDNIRPDPARFPSGIPALAKYIHSKGLLFGLYTCAGNKTCKYGRTGSGGHFEQDAKTFADWEIDYIKMDNCHHPSTPPHVYYAQMRDALNSTGRPMVFSLCEWGEEQVWTWGMQTGNMWRIHADHLPLWFGSQGTLNIIDSYVGISQYSGPGGWNDADFLMTTLPPFMSFIDSRTEYSFWSLVNSPLMVTVDIRNMTEERRSILMNPEVIAVNQDPLGISGDRIWNNSALGVEVWSKPLSDGSYAVILFNRNDIQSSSVPVRWAVVNSKWTDDTVVRMRDLWKQQDIGTSKTAYASDIAPHDVLMLRVWAATDANTSSHLIHQNQ